MPEEKKMHIDSPQLRIYIMFFAAFLILATLGIQLWNMQIAKRADYEERSRRQSARLIRISPVRGRILFSNGDELASNRVSYDVKFHLSEMRRSPRKAMVAYIMEQAQRTADAIGRDCTLDEKDIIKHMNLKPGAALTVFRDLSETELATLTELDPPLEGLEIAPEPVRSYPNGPLASHITGYVSLETPERYSDGARFSYIEKEYKGRSGLERKFDEKLRGSPGSHLVLVNSSGFVQGELEQVIQPSNGNDIILTLDRKAQAKAEQLLSGLSGAIVMMDAKTGAIKAMASSPSFDCSDFIPRISSRRYQNLANDPATPFVNRTVNPYMPGSIIKVLTSLAILEEGISPFAIKECTGRSKNGYGRGIGCSKLSGHGSVDLRTAIKTSCNVYFVDNGVDIGIDALSRIYASAGIGSKTGIEIDERAGLLPRNTSRWTRNETAYVAFGQGKIEVTPLQAACYISAIANNGLLPTPYLIEHIRDTNSGSDVNIYDAAPKSRGRLAATKQAINIVKEGMYAVVNEPGGTAFRAKIDDPSIKFYGKTGTADYITSKEVYKDVWFAGFAEKEDEIYAVTVMIEHGASGGGTAAPIASKLLKSYLIEKEAEKSAE